MFFIGGRNGWKGGCVAWFGVGYIANFIVCRVYDVCTGMVGWVGEFGYE